MAENPKNNGFLLIIIIVLIGIAVYGFLNLPDNRAPTRR